MRTLVLDHPLAAALLTTMRDEHTGNAAFRTALAELTRMLVFEASRDLETERFEVRTPVGPAVGTRVSNPPLLVPVLRAGLGMVDQASALIPEAHVGFVGLARDEETHAAHEYMVSLPADLAEIPVFVLDPMLATGGSMLHVIELLIKRGARDITALCAVSSPEGIDALDASEHPLTLVTAAVDSHLNENAYIVPGLGDAGDRQFGPR